MLPGVYSRKRRNVITERRVKFVNQPGKRSSWVATVLTPESLKSDKSDKVIKLLNYYISLLPQWLHQAPAAGDEVLFVFVCLSVCNVVASYAQTWTFQQYFAPPNNSGTRTVSIKILGKIIRTVQVKHKGYEKVAFSTNTSLYF